MSAIIVHCHDKFEWFETTWTTCPGYGITYYDWVRND